MTLAFRDSVGNTAVSMKAKKVLIQKSAFLKLSRNLVEPLVISFRLAHIKITKEVVVQALITQASTKAPGSDNINFQILQIVLGWIKAWIISIVYHVI